MRTFRSSTHWIAIVLIMAAGIALSQARGEIPVQATDSVSSKQSDSPMTRISSAPAGAVSAIELQQVSSANGVSGNGGERRDLNAASLFVLGPVQALLLGVGLLIGAGLARRWRRASEN